MLTALIPADVAPTQTSVPIEHVTFAGVAAEVDLESVGFYVPPYLGPGLTLELITQMPNLQAVQVLTAGYDAALAYVPKHVTLSNAVGVHDDGTAELAVALTLASLRGIDDFARAMLTGSWIHTRRTSLIDQRAMVVGAGGVGQAIAARLTAFGVKVKLVGRSARPGILDQQGMLDELGQTDLVVLAVPLTPDTDQLVDADFLGRMAPGSLLVNVARGRVVDTDSLVAAVSSGRIRAALDVTDPEPLPADHPLWHLPGVLISPHVGGDSSAFLPRARALVATQLERWTTGQELQHQIAH